MKQKRIIAFLIDAFSIVFLTIIVRLILNVDDAQLSLMFFSLLASFLIICIKNNLNNGTQTCAPYNINQKSFPSKGGKP